LLYCVAWCTVVRIEAILTYSLSFIVLNTIFQISGGVFYVKLQNFLDLRKAIMCPKYMLHTLNSALKYFKFSKQQKVKEYKHVRTLIAFIYFIFIFFLIVRLSSFILRKKFFLLSHQGIKVIIRVPTFTPTHADRNITTPHAARQQTRSISTLSPFKVNATICAVVKHSKQQTANTSMHDYRKVQRQSRRRTFFYSKLRR